MKDNNFDNEIAEELMNIFLSGIKKDKNKKEIEEKLRNIFNRVLDNAIEEEIDKKDIKINNRRFVKFKEISNKDKISDIWIDTTKIITIFDYNGEVAIRIDAPEFFIYKVEGTVEEVLDKLRDRN